MWRLIMNEADLLRVYQFVLLSLKLVSSFHSCDHLPASKLTQFVAHVLWISLYFWKDLPICWVMVYFFRSIYWWIYPFASSCLWRRHWWSALLCLFIERFTHFLMNAFKGDPDFLLHYVYLLKDLLICGRESLKPAFMVYPIWSIYWHTYSFASASLWNRHSWSTQFGLFIDKLTYSLAHTPVVLLDLLEKSVKLSLHFLL